MREQLAQHGWVGTEITTGSDARHIAVSSVFDEIPLLGLFPSTAPRNVKRTRQENTPILIAARSCSVAGRAASEVWCFDSQLGHLDAQVTEAFMDQSLRELAHTLQMRGVLVEEPRFFFGGDLPSDHLFTMDGVLSMRRVAKKSLAAGAHAHPRRDNTTSERLSPASAGRPPHTGRCQWRLPH